MPSVHVLPTTNKVITDAVLSEKLTVPKLVKNLPEFFCHSTVHYSAITTRYLSLPSARSIQSTVISYLLNTHFNIILPSTQRFPSGLFSFRFPHQNCKHHSSPLLTSPPHVQLAQPIQCFMIVTIYSGSSFLARKL